MYSFYWLLFSLGTSQPTHWLRNRHDPFSQRRLYQNYVKYICSQYWQALKLLGITNTYTCSSFRHFGSALTSWKSLEKSNETFFSGWHLCTTHSRGLFCFWRFVYKMMKAGKFENDKLHTHLFFFSIDTILTSNSDICSISFWTSFLNSE